MTAAQSRAAAVRVTTWNLRSIAAATNNLAPSEITARSADILRKLNSDVIILENVPDRESCQLLADALKPQNYQIAACSSFLNSLDGKKIKQQVAILSKTRPLLGWSEAWQSSGEIQALPGGFAFAEVRLDGKNLGLFVTHLGLDEFGASHPDLSLERRSRVAAIDQLRKNIESFRNWSSNRIDTVVVAGDFQSGADVRSENRLAFSNLIKNGFQLALDWLPGESQSTVDYIFTRGAGPVANVVFSPVEFSTGQPVTCDISLDAPKPFVAKTKPDVSPKTALPGAVSVPAAPPLAPSNAVTQPPAVRTEIAVAKPQKVQNPPAPAPKIAPTPNVVQPPAPLHATVEPPRNPDAFWRLAGVFGIGLFVFLVVWRLLFPGKFRPGPQTISKSELPPGAKSLMLAQNLSPAERAGLLSHLSLWLKQKFVQRLVSDRAQLMATQQAAALAVMAMDERLTNVEKQIQQRNQEYEQRIEELLKELAVAQEENRELIRSKIELLKLEIAKSSGKPVSFPSRN